MVSSLLIEVFVSQCRWYKYSAIIFRESGSLGELNPLPTAALGLLHHQHMLLQKIFAEALWSIVVSELQPKPWLGLELTDHN